MLLLEAHHIKVEMKDRLIVDIPQLEIHEHDRIGLVGKNGAGKTTLLELLSGRRKPDEGVVKAYGTCELLPQLKLKPSTKSGGELTQEYIQQTVSRSPAILLADEPTTNLDTAHIEWLEKTLMNWQGAFVIVSHDRAFLDALCTTIWEVQDGHIQIYKGNYTAYAEQKELKRREHEAAYEKYMQKKRQLELAMEQKQLKAERATVKPKHVSPSEARITGSKPYFAKKQKKLQKTAKSIEVRMEKLEKVEKIKESPALRMNLPHEQQTLGRIVLRAKDVAGMIGQRVLWKAASFEVRGGDKLAILGPNGSGKTTLLKKIMQQAEGMTLSPALKIGYFSQNIDILDVEQTILHNVRITSKQTETFIRTVLARLHFFTDDVYKPVGVLSGGERVKVALAKCFVSDINMLILDEPTNFLDIEAMEALESLLQEYQGTVLFVSHDRRFVEQIATRILMIEQGEIQCFAGTWQEYQAYQPQPIRNTREDELLLLETKITEVLSRLSIEPSAELEVQFQQLLAAKRKLNH